MSRPIFPELERALVERAGATVPSRSSTRIGRAGRSLARGLVPAVTVAVSIAVLVVGVVALRGGQVRRESPGAQPSAAVPAAARAALSKYSIFSRAQTSTDLSIAGTLRPVGGKFFVTNLVARGQQRQTYVVSPIPSYVVVPALTRGIERDGTRVGLFVERLVRPTVALRVTTTSGRPVSATTRAAVLMALHGDFLFAGESAGHQAPFQLVTRANGAPGGGLDAPTALPLRPINAAADSLYRMLASSIRGRGSIVAIVPDGVRTVHWVWSRQFEHQLHRYLPRIVVSAPAFENVAVAPAPARFERSGDRPTQVILSGPTGNTIANVVARVTAITRRMSHTR